MDPTETQPEHAGDGIDYDRAGPAAIRMLLGARLRKLREAAGVTPEDAAFAIRASASKISRMELGRTGFKPRDVADLLVMYRVSKDERATLLAMAEPANASGWWQAYSEVIPAWFAPYLGLEQAATVIRTYEVQFIPGLLQTEEYAEAVLQIGARDFTARDLTARDTGQQLTVRMRRQQILHRPSPPRLWAVIDEGALRRPIGGAGVARAQLRHLIEMTKLSHITIQVARFSGGSRGVANGPVTVLRFPEAELADLVYLEQHTTARYLTKPAERLDYWNSLNRLATEAAPPGETPAILLEIINEM